MTWVDSTIFFNVLYTGEGFWTFFLKIKFNNFVQAN